MFKKSEKRRSIFIDRAFQGRFMLNVLLVIILSGLCSALIVYWFTGGDLQAASQTAHQNISNAMDNLGATLIFANFAAMLLAIGLALFFVLYASHKIAGPLYRFEKMCQQIGNGELDGETKLRKDDQLQDMGTAFQEMVDKLRHRRDERAALAKKIGAELDALERELGPEAKHAQGLKQIREWLTQIHH